MKPPFIHSQFYIHHHPFSPNWSSLYLLGYKLVGSHVSTNTSSKVTLSKNSKKWVSKQIIRKNFKKSFISNVILNTAKLFTHFCDLIPIQWTHLWIGPTNDLWHYLHPPPRHLQINRTHRHLVNSTVILLKRLQEIKITQKNLSLGLYGAWHRLSILERQHILQEHVFSNQILMMLQPMILFPSTTPCCTFSCLMNTHSFELLISSFLFTLHT